MKGMNYMDLSTQENKVLLKKCIKVMLFQLKFEQEQKDKFEISSTDIEEEIKLYEQMEKLIESDDTDSLINTLKKYQKIDSISKLSSSVLSNRSSVDLADEYLNSMKNFLIKCETYSEEYFNKFKTAFLSGTNIESDMTKDINKLEEEPSHEVQNITPKEKELLGKLYGLVKMPSGNNLSTSKFKQLAFQFGDLTKQLGICKFQHSFDEEKKNILDMNISFNSSKYQKPVYLTVFDLEDTQNKERSNVTVYEPASISGFSSTYYQNLCFAYLEANETSKLDESKINSDLISQKMSTFSNCYENLQSMILKCNLQIKNGHVFQIAESSYVPSPELSITDNKERDDEEEMSL